MKVGIIGLPNVGKSTLFNAITNAGAQAANYPFCTIEPNIGVVAVPDKRLDALAKIYSPLKNTPAVIEFLDIAGLVRGASKGEGLGNKFLANIREVDAIVQVVRCFEDTEIIHVEGSVDPMRDVDIVNLELIFADLELASRREDKARKSAKGDKKYDVEADFFMRLAKHLEDGKPAYSFETTGEDEDYWLNNSGLLSSKPMIYAANLSEADFKSETENKGLIKLRELAARTGSKVLPICAKLEEEITELTPDEKLLFLADLGMDESGLDRLVREAYDLLGLISYLTAGQPEVRAWTIKKGTKAPQAAGKIHSDFERGFIRAEVISFDELIKNGSIAAAKEKGLVRSEGKEYVMQDGDVVLFRFNV
ncbi:MAG TPA: redox-regulated ATPase YchF [Oscillospiraceae bacterium]|nr:redox-regulated ATPase YchF [Oscillospiraceae bacterium]HPS34096.1 redox-regulated ATPase YchF [Oscillospiraceae bacterium]